MSKGTCAKTPKGTRIPTISITRNDMMEGLLPCRFPRHAQKRDTEMPTAPRPFRSAVWEPVETIRLRGLFTSRLSMSRACRRHLRTRAGRKAPPSALVALCRAFWNRKTLASQSGKEPRRTVYQIRDITASRIFVFSVMVATLAFCRHDWSAVQGVTPATHIGMQSDLPSTTMDFEMEWVLSATSDGMYSPNGIPCTTCS